MKIFAIIVGLINNNHVEEPRQSEIFRTLRGNNVPLS